MATNPTSEQRADKIIDDWVRSPFSRSDRHSWIAARSAIAAALRAAELAQAERDARLCEKLYTAANPKDNLYARAIREAANDAIS